MSIYFYFLYRHTQCHILLSSLMSTSPTKCSKPSCKNLVSDDNLNIHGLKYKKCKSCREKDSANTADRRKRKREEQPSSTEQGPSTRPRPSPSNLDEVVPGWSKEISSDEDASQVSKATHYFNNQYLPLVTVYQGIQRWRGPSKGSAKQV